MRIIQNSAAAMSPKYQLLPITSSETTGQETYTWLDFKIISEEGVSVAVSPNIDSANAPIYRRIGGRSGEITLTKNDISTRITHNFGYTLYREPYQFVVDSLAEMQSLIDATSGHEENMKIFSSKNCLTETYVRNVNLWCGVDIASQLTGVIAYKKWSGATESYGGVMITPRHFLCCRHAHPHASGTWAVNGYAQFDSRVDFVTMNNDVVTRTHIAQGYPNNAGVDLCVGVLDAPVPETIHICPMYSLSYEQAFNQINTLGAYGVSVSQGSGGTRSPLIPPDYYGFGYSPDVATYPISNEPMLYLESTQAPLAQSGENQIVLEALRKLGYNVWSGDSGTPGFMLIDGNLMISGIVSGGFYTDSFVTDINQAIYNADLQAISLGRMSTPTGLTFTIAPVPIN